MHYRDTSRAAVLHKGGGSVRRLDVQANEYLVCM